MSVAAAKIQELFLHKQTIQYLINNHPLAFAKLWHREEPRTSQRRALMQMGKMVTVVCGGNRSGKTECAAQLAVAVALGRQHPDVKEWMRINRVPLDAVPLEPGVVWAVALDSGDSREYVRPCVAQYLPPQAKWRNQEGLGRAEVKIKTEFGEGRILFPSVDQGRDGFQGSACDLVWFDEEPNDESVVNEALMRLVDKRGRMVLTLTPLRGRTWLYDRWVSVPVDDVKVHWLHGMDNPHVPSDVLAKMLDQFGEHERAARELGSWVCMEGRVYDFSRQVHVVPHKPLPRSWRRFRSIDFGTRNPFACIWGALDEDDRLHIYNEHYQREWTLSKHAHRINLMTGGHDIEFTIADPEDRGSRLALAREHDIPTVKGNKSVRAGINAVAERLRPMADGRPSLFIHDNCKHLIGEFESYVWASSKTKANLPDMPLKKNDHALDALRYLIMALRNADFAMG